jgi:hypothetical protein
LTSGNEVDIASVDVGLESVDGDKGKLLFAAPSTAVDVVAADGVACELAGAETETDENEMLVGWLGLTPTA